MHPNPAFRADGAAMRALLLQQGFGALFAQLPAGPQVAHVPVTLADDGRLLFHLARGNALCAGLAGAQALFVAQGPHAYVSPGWYRRGPDEVPTWNYLAVEVEGRIAPIDDAELRGQIEAMAARYEPADGWRLDAMTPSRADAMLRAIQGFALEPVDWRGTFKLSQNKPAEVRARVIDALGPHPLAAAMAAA